MCIIASCSKRKMTKEEFDQCFTKNKDGCGMAFYKNGELNYIKGIMKKERAWKIYEKIDTFPHVVHFRIGTSGGISRAMTHPFLITPNSPNVTKYKGNGPILFHNGIWSPWKDELLDYIMKTKIVPEGPVSDTRAMAMILSQEKDQKKALDKPSGKWVYMDNEGLVRYGAFEDVDGIYFSNGGYKEYKVPAKSSYGYGCGGEYDNESLYDEFYKNKARSRNASNIYHREPTKHEYVMIADTIYKIRWYNEWGMDLRDMDTNAIKWIQRKDELLKKAVFSIKLSKTIKMWDKDNREYEVEHVFDTWAVGYKKDPPYYTKLDMLTCTVTQDNVKLLDKEKENVYTVDYLTQNL